MGDQPRRIQRKRTKVWRMPKNTVYDNPTPEWQPARLILAHEDVRLRTDIGKVLRSVIYIKEAIPHPLLRRLWTCDAKRFYVVREDPSTGQREKAWVCEHEILTA